MDLSVIIVSFNVKNLLKDCLQSIYKNRDDLEIEVIVVDNASSDGSAEMVRKKFSQVKLIENKGNLGFARAANQALRLAQSEYILLLNPDIEVRKNACKSLIKFAQKHPEAGITAGQLLNPDKTIQGSCFHQLAILNAIKEFWLGEKGAFEKYAPKTEEPVEVEAVVGACMLIPKKAIEKVGFFDERYFMYFEDLDYCRRVKRAGFKVYYFPKAEFIHYHGASGKEILKQTRQWLAQSSKIYHGKVKYYLLVFIIWLGEKWQRFLRR